MAESVRVKLEVVASPTFSLSTPRHIFGAVVGDEVEYVVTMSAVGSFTDDVVLVASGYPDGAGVTYDPVDATIAPGETLTVTIDTTGCSAGTYTVTVAEA